MKRATEINLIEKIVTEEVGAKDIPPFNPFGVEKKKYNLLTWRWGPISLSKLLALFPLFFFITWLIVLGFTLFNARFLASLLAKLYILYLVHASTG